MVYLYERCGNTMLVANILIVAKSLFVVNSNVVANDRIYQALGFRNFHCVGCARFRPTCVLQYISCLFTASPLPLPLLFSFKLTLHGRHVNGVVLG